MATGMRPDTTLSHMFVDPKDKVEPKVQGEQVHQIACKCSGKTYLAETENLFKTCLEEPNDPKTDRHSQPSTRPLSQTTQPPKTIE